MDPRFHNLMSQELRALLAEHDGGKNPSNPDLMAAVTRVLREQNPKV